MGGLAKGAALFLGTQVFEAQVLLRVERLRKRSELQVAPGHQMQAHKSAGEKRVAQKKRRHGQIEEKKRR